MRAAAMTVLLLAGAARADELAGQTVAVVDMKGPLPAEAAAPAWDKIPPAVVPLAPQRALHLNDARANAALAQPGPPREVLVRAVAGERDLALLLEWSDPTCDRGSPEETDRFGDAAAVELPLRFGAGVRLPYIGMGDDEQPVALYHVRAAEGRAVAREAVAAGFGSSTRADLGGLRVDMACDAARGRWRALLSRPLATEASDLRQGLVPFAVAVWDGGRNERGGNKALSGWRFLRLARYPLDAGYAAELSWSEPGDAARGKVLVDAVCVACHLTADKRVAPPGLAPDLSSVGAVSTPAYLRQSLLDPSAVIVPGPNVNQHVDKAGARSDVFMWSMRDPSGKKISKMPSFATLPPADQAAIVAYLRTLGAPPARQTRKESP